MKIGILTLRLHSNYGGILQAYALMTVLKRLGHEPVLIYNQSFKYRSGMGRALLYCTNICKKYLLGQHRLEVFRERRFKNTYETVCKNTREFVDRHLTPRTDFVVTGKDWSSLQQKYHFDAYVVGSDQVWRPAYSGAVEHFFLSFLSEEYPLRIAYAASFGTDNWTFTDYQTEVCQQLLQKFHAVSVREDSAVQLCERRLGYLPVHVLDPTMLLLKCDYLNLLPEFQREPKGLLVYVLDHTEEKSSVVANIADELHESCFFVNNKDAENEKKQCTERVAPPVEDWLKGFASAKYVITDSFHACVFSILFHIPFFVIGNESRGNERILSLLRMFRLEPQRQFIFKVELMSVLHVNWSEIDCLLDEYRQSSLSFLNRSLVRKQ